MNHTDTAGTGISSRITQIRGAHGRMLVPPPSYPGLRQRAATSRLYERLARLVALDA